MFKLPSKIREILNKIKWDPQLNEKNYYITFIHRGFPDDKKTIESRVIKTISSSFFSYFEGEDISYIPFHRILLIKEKESNQIIYKKK